MGTWCPNCRDEAVFLKEYLQSHPNSNFAVIALAFERSADSAVANAQIKVYKDKMKIPYQILDAGTNNKDAASKTLPMLNKIMAFPTTIFLDRANNIRKIHTGFDGPATSKYEAYKKDFGTFMDELLAEKAR